MKTRKWIVPVCVVVGALAAALVLLLMLTPRVSLYDFARSLSEDSLFVCCDGSVWRAQEDAVVSGEKLVPTGAWAPWYVERGAKGEDRDLPAWGFALRLGANKVFIRSDGSLWMCYYDDTRESRVLLFMEEVMVEPTGAESPELRNFELIPHDSYLRIPAQLRFIAVSEEWGAYTARLSVLLQGRWYSVTRADDSVVGQDAGTINGSSATSFALSFWDVPSWSRELTAVPGVIPSAVYRAELWDGDTLLRTRSFLRERLSGGRALLNTDERAISAWLDG